MNERASNWALWPPIVDGTIYPARLYILGVVAIFIFVIVIVVLSAPLVLILGRPAEDVYGAVGCLIWLVPLGYAAQRYWKRRGFWRALAVGVLGLLAIGALWAAAMMMVEGSEGLFESR
jgi:hypothetical protein